MQKIMVTYPRLRFATPLLAGLLFLSILSSAHAQDVAKSERVVHALQHDGKHFRARVNEKTGAASWILDVDSLDFTLGRKQYLNSEASLKEAARAFLAAHADVFGIHPDQLTLKSVSNSGELWFVSYIQVYHGLPVVNSEVGVTVTRGGKLVAAGARAYPDVDVDLVPRLSAQDAVQSAQQRVDFPEAEPVEASELVIVPVESENRYTFRLAWSLDLENLDIFPPRSTTYLIDAHTGEIIAEHEKIASISSASYKRDSNLATPVGNNAAGLSAADPSIPSRPMVEEEDGSAISHSVWGYVKLNYYETPDDFEDPFDRFTDQAFYDARVIALNIDTQERDTVYANGSGYYSISGLSATTYSVTFEIANQKAHIESGLSASQQRKSFTVNVSGAVQQDYDWNWGDSGDGGITSYALNGVYHVRQMYDYFKNTYSYSAMDGQKTPVRVQSSGSGEHAGSTNGTKIWLGGAEAMSSEVALHEHAHMVIYKLYGNDFIKDGQTGQTLKESFAMDEGLADYFAADKTDNSTFGGPEANADPNAPEDDGVGIRFLWNDCTMNDFDSGWPCGGNNVNAVDDAHNRGRLIGGGIWRIRHDIGTEASQLLFTALQITPQPHTFEELRDRLEAADVARNSGANAGSIENRFTERYIGPPNGPGFLFLTLDANDYPYLTWNDISGVEDGYRVERKYNTGSWTVIENLSAGSESFTDDIACTGGGSGTNYYRVQVYYENAGHPDGVSYSNTVSLSQSTCYVPMKASPGEPERNVPQIVEEPEVTALFEAYPNPFNPKTRIRYTLADTGSIRLVVYDLLGREVAVLVAGIRQAGEHFVDFEASHLPSGLYLFRLETGNQHFSRTLLLAK